MDELDAMKSVDDTLAAIGDKVMQKRLLVWAWAKYIGEDMPNSELRVDKENSVPERKKRRVRSPAAAKKQSYEQVKTLNLKPSGKTSLQEFVEAKNPVTYIQRVVVSVYYLKEEVGEEAVSINHVYTCFKWMKWKLPSDLKNTIHQAGAQGLLDTRMGDDLRLTHMGENLVEHELGQTAAA